MSLVRIFLLLLSAFAISSATASPPAKRDYAAMYEGCLGSYGYVNNGSVASCAESVGEDAEVEIKELHKKLLDYFAEYPKDRESQQKAQDAWLTYRDNQCRLAGSHVGSPMYYTCPMKLNIQRVDQLREMLRIY